jgi:DHA2 family multidrug resistance protein
VLPQIVQGIGVACFFMPLTTISLSGLHPNQIASAASLSNFLRVLGGSIGASVTTTLWDNREATHHAVLTQSLSLYDNAAIAWGKALSSLGLSSSQQAAFSAAEITRQGYILGANEIFWGSGWLFIVLMLLIWQARPPFRQGGGDTGAH